MQEGHRTAVPAVSFIRSVDDNLPESGASSQRADQKVGPGFGRIDAMTALSRLSPSENRVLQEALSGMSVREIAERLVVTEATVKTHLAHIYGKLGVRGRVDLLARVRDGQVPGERGPDRIGSAARTPRGSGVHVPRVLPPLLVVVVAVGVLIVAGIALTTRPTQTSLAQIEQLIASGGVSQLRLEDSTLQATTSNGDRLEVLDVRPEAIRPLAVEHGVPLDVAAAARGPSVPILLVVSLAPYVLFGGLIWLGWAAWRSLRGGADARAG